MGSSSIPRNTNRPSYFNDPVFKLLFLLIMLVCTVNFITFTSFIDDIPSMHLPSMHMPEMHLRDNVEEERSDAELMTVDRYKEEFTRQVAGLANQLKKKEEHTDFKNEGKKEDDENENRIIELLEKVGVEITPELKQTLPPWSSITSQYGSKPIIHGLETCQTFRSTIPNADAFVAPAGMFNTGTNLISKLLIANCYLPEKVKKLGEQSIGMRLQVPWGKHVPATWRLSHSSKVAGKIDQKAVLPVVMVKDPYHWMGSMCRHPYTSYWDTSQGGSCPNLVKEGGALNEVEVRYHPEVTKHESLVGLWNDFNGLYDEADYPRLIVRYEDVLFFPEYITEKVCKCAGGVLRDEESIKILEDSAKSVEEGHVNTNGLVSAITRYGDERKRVDGFTDVDREYAEKALRRDLVEKFGYKVDSLVGRMAS